MERLLMPLLDKRREIIRIKVFMRDLKELSFR